MSQRDERVLLVDIESTGLDGAGPGGLLNGGALLEVGLMLTDRDLTVIASVARPVLHGPVAVAALRAAATPDVQKMHAHAQAGDLPLWDLCARPHGPVWGQSMPLVEVETVMLAFLADHDVAPGTLAMTGSSVHTDRNWLRAHMPRLASMFHYRNIDISTVKELVRRWLPADVVKRGAPIPTKAHRAIPDLHDSVAELAHYRQLLTSQVVGTVTHGA